MIFIEILKFAMEGSRAVLGHCAGASGSPDKLNIGQQNRVSTLSQKRKSAETRFQKNSATILGTMICSMAIFERLLLQYIEIISRHAHLSLRSIDSSHRAGLLLSVPVLSQV